MNLKTNKQKIFQNFDFYLDFWKTTELFGLKKGNILLPQSKMP